MHHAETFVCAYVLRQYSYTPFLTNLEDEISVKGVGFVRPKIDGSEKMRTESISHSSLELNIGMGINSRKRLLICSPSEL
jgi:hypothetical protein